MELNIDLVEKACTVIRSAVASAMDWGDIELLVKEAKTRGDPVAMSVHSLKLQSNEICMLLTEPFQEEEEEEEGEEERGTVKRKEVKIRTCVV